MQKILAFLLICLLLTGCASPEYPSPTPGVTTAASATPTQAISSPASPLSTSMDGTSGIPAFDHIVLILLENHSYSQVIGSADMPFFNRLARENVLLTHFYAVAHPSLPNYLALIGGSTFGITSDCTDCYVNAASLPDLLEVAGRTWKTYQEDLPSPCYYDFSGKYDLNHNPFVYFDPIRTDLSRCQGSVVPLTQLDKDLNAGRLPSFAFITPNICNDAHNCKLTTADRWLETLVPRLQDSPALGRNSAIFILFDEAFSDNSACCGLSAPAGGHVAAILISPLAKSPFQDNTPLNHYSLLKTILTAWNLPGLGETENPATQAITAPWKNVK